MGGTISSISNAVNRTLDSKELRGAVKTGAQLGLVPKTWEMAMGKGPQAPEQGPDALDAQAAEMEKQRKVDLFNQEKALRDKSNAYLEQLRQVASGTKMDPAMALQQQMNLSQQVGAAKANKSVNPALASRTVAQNAATMNALQGAQGAINAQNAMGTFLGNQQQIAQSGIAANQGVASAAQLQAMRNANDIKLSDRKEDWEREKGVIKGTAEAAATFITSDKNAKKDIKPAEKSNMNTEHFLSKIGSHAYKYKDDKNGKGTFVSPMAQELEKAGPVGKSMVINTEEGKQVDYGRGFGAILAAQADLNKRLQKIENKKG